MGICPRCGRGHSGLCGIPAGVTLGFGARIGGAGIEGGRSTPRGPEVVHGKPKVPRPSTAVLEEILERGRQQYAEVVKMLKLVPPEMPEYADLIDRESKLLYLIKQVEGQIAAARGVK